MNSNPVPFLLGEDPDRNATISTKPHHVWLLDWQQSRIVIRYLVVEEDSLTVTRGICRYNRDGL